MCALARVRVGVRVELPVVQCVPWLGLGLEFALGLGVRFGLGLGFGLGFGFGLGIEVGFGVGS